MALPSGADKGRRPKKRALSNVKRVGSLVSWPLPVLSCCAGAFLAPVPAGFALVFLACFWPLASRSSPLDGRDVGLDLFSFSRRWAPDPSTSVSRYHFTFVAVVVPLRCCLRLSLLLSFAVVLYFAVYGRFLPERVVPAEIREVQCVRWKLDTLTK